MNRLLHHTVKEIEQFFAVLADNNTPERKKSSKYLLEKLSKQTENCINKEFTKPETKH